MALKRQTFPTLSPSVSVLDLSCFQKRRVLKCKYTPSRYRYTCIGGVCFSASIQSGSPQKEQQREERGDLPSKTPPVQKQHVLQIHLHPTARCRGGETFETLSDRI